MILAEVSSGRSDLASASPTKDETPGSAAAATGLDRGLASRPGRAEGGGAHGDDDLRIGRLDRLDRVAGVDRPLEGLGADHLGDVGDLHHVEQRRRTRGDVLRARGRRRDDRVIGRSERDDQRGGRLGQRVGVDRVVGDQHLRDARELRGRLGRRADVLAGDQHVDRLPDLERRGQRARGHVAQAAAATSARRRVAMIRSLPLRRAASRPAPPPTSL